MPCPTASVQRKRNARHGGGDDGILRKTSYSYGQPIDAAGAAPPNTALVLRSARLCSFAPALQNRAC